MDGPFTHKVPENGLIAVNVPLDPLRLGALSTRTTHPFYIARWNDALDALGITGRIENPYWDRTKGEMAEKWPIQRFFGSSRPHRCPAPRRRRVDGETSARSTAAIAYLA